MVCSIQYNMTSFLFFYIFLDNLNDTSSEISSVSSYRTSRYNVLVYTKYIMIAMYYMIKFYSTRTSCRSARKQQRKMWNLKKGNFREQPTIILNLKQIIEKFDKFKGYLFNFHFYNVYKIFLIIFF